VEKLNKNFIWLSAANIVGSIFSVLLFIYLARVLKAESFGYLSYATTFVFYMFNFVDLGLSTYGMREIAKNKTKISEYVSNIVSFRLMLAGILFLIFLIGVALSRNTAILKILMVEVALMLFVASLATEWAFQGLENMHMVFVSLATTTFLQLVLNCIFVHGPEDLLKIPIINFIAVFPILLTFLWILKFRLTLKKLDMKMIKFYLSSSIVIWGISVCAQAYNGLDIVFLGFFRTPEEVGCFTVARRICGGATLLLVVLANAIFPHLSSMFGKDIDQFRYATHKYLKISVFILLFLLLPIMFFSRDFIALTVGAQYISAAIPLKVMVVALILVMFNMPFSTGLIAAGFEKDVLKQVAACASLNILSNFILIPKYGMMGASISFLWAEALALGWILHIYHKKIRFVN
jgi:O-antigen/teichoic acid export membrane protein